METPPTILDIQRSRGWLDMELPMADPCPQCGAFRLILGDWVGCGVCEVCAAELDYEKSPYDQL